jgi:UDP-3-O-[3-hydroxymyristoyl] glucosamine N-acyltransferase
MESRGFFPRQGPFTLNEIAQHAGAELASDVDVNRQIRDIAPLADAGQYDLSFLDNRKYVAAVSQTSAGACLLHREFADKLPEGTAGLYTERPYHALAHALQLFYPDAQRPLVHQGQGGTTHEDAQVEEGVSIEPGATVGARAQVGRGSVIAAGAVIGTEVRIGRDCYVGPNASITHALVGDRVVLHAGVAVGQDGFGFAMGPQGHLKVPQIGRVIIQDDVEIGANSTVDRGALSDTVIGEGTKIDNLVQIGHNVRIGRHCVIAGMVGISGSSILEDFVVMGGQSGCVGHVRIGKGAQIAGSSGLSHSVPPGERWGGTPAKRVAAWSRELAVTKLLSETLKGKALARLKQLLS